MAQSRQRPLSPHLSNYRWGPHMLVSILHRATGDGMAVVGGLTLLWWLYAVAAGGATYQLFLDVASGIFGRIVLIGLSWAFVQHMVSGLRHFVMDMGAGYELKTNRAWSIATIILSVAATAALWAWLLLGRAH